MTKRTVPLGPGLAARVTHHAAAAGDRVIPCATWVSEGFAALDHPELTLTLRRAEGADEDTLSLEAIRFFLGVFESARAGRGLAVGSLGEFPAGLFEGGEAPGFVCVHPGATRDPAAPARGLRVVVLARDELALASTCGPRRVLARLARAARCAPFPPWWDAARPSVAHPDDRGSVLLGSPRVRVLDAAAWRAGDTVHLRLAPGARGGLRDAVERVREAPSFALVVDAPADADAWLVWTPGQSGIAAASRAESPGRRVAGNFVLLARGDGAAAGGHAEDGFAFALGDDTRDALLAALSAGEGFALAPGDRTLGLRVTWEEPEALPDPVPAARYLGVEALAGLGPRPAVDREEFTRYARAVCKVIDEHFEATWSEPGQDLLVHVELHPQRRPMASVALRPAFAHPTLNGLCAAVEDLAAPAVTGPAVFRVEFALWGGAG